MGRNDMLQVSESYIVCIDITEDDEAALSITKLTGSTPYYVNTYIGNEAIELYRKLTNKIKRVEVEKLKDRSSSVKRLWKDPQIIKGLTRFSKYYLRYKELERSNANE
jgi:hypothetical protein